VTRSAGRRAAYATAFGAAEIGSKLTEPKFASDEADNPHLGDMVTLETLSIGVAGKQCMWQTLQKVTDAYPALAEGDRQHARKVR